MDGNLHLEVMPSLTSTILTGLKSLDTFPIHFTEPVASRVLALVEAQELFSAYGWDPAPFKEQADRLINPGLTYLANSQNDDGSWGWRTGEEGDALITAFSAYTLLRASQTGLSIDQEALQLGIAQMINQVNSIQDTDLPNQPAYVLERLAFQHFVLSAAGQGQTNVQSLATYRQQIAPWAAAMVAMALDMQSPGSGEARVILAELMDMSTTDGVEIYWQTTPVYTPDGDFRPTLSYNLNTPQLNSAIISLALTRLEPESGLLNNTIFHLLNERNLNVYNQSTGGWSSSYETAWVILTLKNAILSTGGLQGISEIPALTFTTSLNNTPLITQQAATEPFTTFGFDVPYDQLQPQMNQLSLQYEAGHGLIVYQSNFTTTRQAGTAPGNNAGIAISRDYYRTDVDCKLETCTPISEISLGIGNQPILVQLTVTIAEDMHYVMINDYFPGGTEVIDPTLRTYDALESLVETYGQLYDPSAPLSGGWGWWYFEEPKTYNDHIQWVTEYLPAGTHMLVYELIPKQAGEYQIIPANAYQYYNPQINGNTPGEWLKISP